MGRTVAIGIQNFAVLREKNCFYVDKTDFIKEWWETEDDVTLITRPRRFGKTLNISMLECFFSINYANRGDLFEGLSIWKEEKYRSLQGTWPVISLSFANIKETDFKTTQLKIRLIIKNLCSDYLFLLDSEKLAENEKDFIERGAKGKLNETEETMILYQLSKALSQYYGKKAIILLDEYDTPMQEAYIHGFWPELAGFIRSLFNSAFKTNPYLARGILTGITRISKESIFSDLNHLKVVTTTSDEYSTAFGFTEEEVFAALEECGLAEKKIEVKRWYDGFTFGEQKDIYNPWSIINFLNTGKLAAYWANTSNNGPISRLLQRSGKQVKTAFESLLHGETIVSPIDEQIIYDYMDNNETAIFSLLVASGYLKVVKIDEEPFLTYAKPRLYTLALTNNEVRSMFMAMFQDWFGYPGSEYNEFIKALLIGNIKMMNIFMNSIMIRTFSYFDTGNQPSIYAPERFYHGFVLGLLADLSDRYTLTSNRESGFGRYDVVIEPFDQTKNAFILEFKVKDPNEESLEATVETALAQIEEKRYDTDLLAKGFKKEQIKKYGFAFEGKKVLIG
ncbi:MAG: AAA family ATPase [Lachnospiraceae bacterium]|nr:AAA family ATPase [Lachnospiraceae bacterium]